MSLQDPYEGQKFSSFDVLKKYLEEYGQKNFVKFWIRSSHTISSFKSKTTKKLNPDLKYVCMKFACIFGGEKTRFRGTGIRRSATYRNLGCPCTINAVIGEDGNHVKLETVILKHNHVLCKSLYDSLKKSKRKVWMLESELNKNSLINKTVNCDKVDLTTKEMPESIGSLSLDDQAKDLAQINYGDAYIKVEDCDNGEQLGTTPSNNIQDYMKQIQKKYGSNIKIIVVNRDESKICNEDTKETGNGFVSEDYNDEELMNLGQGDDKYELLRLSEVKEICRLCLSTSNKLNPIFKPSLPLESTMLSFKIMSCASIEVRNDDDLPRHICTTCEEILDIAYNFRIKCENSDSILRKANSCNSEVDINGISKILFQDNSEGCCEEIKNNLTTEEKVIEFPICVKSEETLMEYDKNTGYDIDNKSCVQLGETCPICGEIFDTYLVMLHHLEEHTDIENFLLPCNLCTLIFTTVKALIDHINEHMIETNWTNKLIGDSDSALAPDDVKINDDRGIFKDGKTFGVETRGEKCTSGNGYLCNVCGKILKSKDRFQSHRNVHEGLRPHICSKCGRGFADRKNMHQHYDIVHLRKAKHECPICHKKFYAPTKMKSHITMHYGVKPFSCDVCNKTFRLRMNMVKHKKTHSKDRPYKCDKCSRAFIDRNLLKRHSYVHGGIRPHVCPFCGHRFTLKFNLKKHMLSGRCTGKPKEEDLNSDYEWGSSSQVDSGVPDKGIIIKCEKSDYPDNDGSVRVHLLQEYEEKE